MKVLSILLALFAAFAFAHAAGNGVTSEKIPSWVNLRLIPAAETDSSADLSAGTLQLLSDEQCDVGAKTLYQHFAKKIVNSSALQNQTKIMVMFDPHYQRLVFHRVLVHRGGRTINLLDIRKVKVFQQEQSLAYDLYDGRFTALLLLEDLRVGDILEYDYSTIGKNPIFNDRFLGSFDLQWSTAVKEVYCRMIVPKGRTITVTNHRNTIAPVITTTAAGVEYVWDRKNVSALNSEDDIPSWYDPYPWIQLSEYRSWKDVAEWAVELFRLAPADVDALRGTVSELKRSAVSDEDYIRKALRFVQDDIRYFGVEIGSQSHRPTKPAVTLRRRFGDCKDKALLFCALLKGAGISAVPVLVNSSLENSVDEFGPSPFAFNHVVARVSLNGGFRYFDPTVTHQRGVFSKLTFPYRLKGLAIDHSTTGLTAIDDGSDAFSRIEVKEHFTSTDFSKPARLQVTTIYYGNNANELRAYFNSLTPERMSRMGSEYYGNEYYKVTTLTPMHIAKDDEDANILTLNEEYAIDSLWQFSEKQGRLQTSFYATLVKDKMHIPTAAGRTMPLGTAHPYHIIYETTIDLPEPWNVEHRTTTVDDSAFFYSFASQPHGKTIDLRYEFRTKKDVVSPASLRSYIDAITKAREDVGYSLYKYPEGSEKLSWIFYAVILFGGTGGGILFVRLWRKKNISAPVIEPENPSVPHATEAGSEILPPVSEPGSVVLPPASEPERAVLPSASEPDIKSPSGIRGWLVLPALGLGVSIIRLIYGISTNYVPVFGVRRWAQLTTPGGDSYNPLNAPVLTGELLFYFGELVFASIVSLYFFRKHRLTPRLMIIWYLVSLTAPIAEQLVLAAIGYTSAANVTPQTIAQSLGGLAVWVPYFLISKRVKNTFVR